MIAKPKDIIFFAYITILTIVAFGYGIATIPSPNEQKNLKLDYQRVTDLEELSYGVNYYYEKNNEFPPSLDKLDTSTYEKYRKDPETEKPYEYTVTGDYTYKLCATFKTDPSQVKKPSNTTYDYTNYTYTGDQGKFNHSKGYKCFDLTLPDYISPKPAIKKNSKTSAKLSSILRTGPCQWRVYFALKGFTPKSPLTISSKGKLSDNCDPNKTHEYSWINSDTGYTTLEDGSAIVVYVQEDYGNYTYTFIDENGNAASATATYDPNNTPSITPATK